MASNKDYDDLLMQQQIYAGRAMAQSSYQNQYHLKDGFHRRHPLEGYDISSIPMSELQMTIDILSREYDRRTLDTPLKAPTQRMLNSNEALRNAWSEFMTIWTLIGKDKK